MIKILFNRRKSPLLLRLGFFIILSALLIALDYHHYLVAPRRALTTVLAPLQYAVDASARFFYRLNELFVVHEILRSENERLRTKQIFLEARLQQFNALEAENRQLSQLLTTTQHLKKHSFTLARLLLVNAAPMLNEVILDKGKLDGISLGQALIDVDGVMGQVISVDLLTSRVLLLTDTRSAIPVQDVRSDARGILVGQGRMAKLLLKDIPGTVDFQVNDLLVTSGLGGQYPPGYPVGIISKVDTNASTQFANIQVDASSKLNKNRPVLLIWPEKTKTEAVQQLSVNRMRMFYRGW